VQLKLEQVETGHCNALLFLFRGPVTSPVQPFPDFRQKLINQPERLLANIQDERDAFAQGRASASRGCPDQSLLRRAHDSCEILKRAITIQLTRHHLAQSKLVECHLADTMVISVGQNIRTGNVTVN
jgi:hypothetical protein